MLIAFKPLSFFLKVRSKFYYLRNGGSRSIDSLLEPVYSGTALPCGPFCDGGNGLNLCCPRWEPPATCGWPSTMVCATEKSFLQMHLILIKLNGCMRLMATALDGAILECWHFWWWDEACRCGLECHTV